MLDEAAAVAGQAIHYSQEELEFIITEKNARSYDRAPALRATRLELRAQLFSSAETVLETPHSQERGNDRC